MRYLSSVFYFIYMTSAVLSHGVQTRVFRQLMVSRD